MSDGDRLAPSGETWTVTRLESFPPLERWDDWVEYDAAAWPRKVERHYRLVPTVCFNCEAACGLVAWVDRDTHRIRKLEGNPYHPGSRGRNCAKGPATLNQVHDPERILYPMKRVGPRGSGQFERTTWDEVIATFAARIRAALVAGRRTEVVYHVGRPGHDGAMERVLQAWGVDGHNSHTNVCSAAARLGYALWAGSDRPSPDHARARFILLLSSHLETGHYFNPHAQRILEAKAQGAKIATVDVRLSNTASMSDWWIAPYPGTEAALLLGFANVLLESGLEDRDFLRRWVNWEDWLAARHGDRPRTFATFLDVLRAEYAAWTPERVAAECDVDADTVRAVGLEIGRARGAFAAHVWRNAAAGNRGGWQVSRCLQLLSVLTGSVNTPGGTAVHTANKFVPERFRRPPPQEVWSEILFPPEWPLAHHEMSFLLPYFLQEGRGHVDVYFTRVYNPVWTNPDGFAWMDVLRDDSKIGLHAALTPTWSETALFADYVLPMGHGPERHDLMSQETHAGRWIAFRQPVARVARERAGLRDTWTRDSNPGEVWEEDEFWIALSWEIDHDGSLGIRPYFESPYRPGERTTLEEHYRWIFENAVPGLPEAAARENRTPLDYMRRYGAFEVQADVQLSHEAPADVTGAILDPERGLWSRDGKPIAVDVEGAPRAGFETPSRKLEIYSPTMAAWGFAAQALPGYVPSHVQRSDLDPAQHRFVLVPTFRLPTLIHTRSANSKWLYEIANANPVWIHPGDARRVGVATGDLVRVATRIGHFVNRAWVTEGIRPGVVACSHHLGRWRWGGEIGPGRWAAPTVEIEAPAGRVAPGPPAPRRPQDAERRTWRVRRTGDIAPFASADPDTERIWWTEGGVHQNLTFPVQPDPISGMHCWHQAVTVEKAREGDRYGDIEVDPEAARDVYREWLAQAPPRPGPGGLRRPEWFSRPFRPSPRAYRRP